MTFRTLGALVVAVAASSACSNKNAKPKTPPVPVAVTRVVRRSVPYNLTADGVVEPMQTAQVQAQVGGILTHVTFKEGDNVQAGQVLFQIDPRPYKAALDQASANLARDEATYKDAAQEAVRYQSLVQKDYVTKEQADQELALAGSTAAAVKGDSAALESARINLDWTTIRAPISGRAGALIVRQGNLVRSGTQQALVLINQIQPILVHFAVPATTLPAIQQYSTSGALAVTVVPGMPPGVTAQPVLNGPTPAYTTEPGADDPAGESGNPSASDDPTALSGSTGGAAGGPPSGPPTGTPGASGAAGGAAGAAGQAGTARRVATGAGGAGRSGASRGANGAAPARGGSTTRRSPGSMPGLPGVPLPAPVQGTLSLIDNQVDTTTGTVLLKASFRNEASTLWPGQFVATSLRLFVQQNALVVPAQAVMTGQQGTYVYLVDASGNAQQRAVNVERTSANTAVIASGLTEGDQVVTDGQSRLTPGAKVNIRGLVPTGSGGASPTGASGSG